MDCITLNEKQNLISGYSTDFQFVAGSLRHTTSKDTGRYDATTQVEPSHASIQAGTFTTPTYLPPQWLAYTHPEGQLYFYRHSSLRVVTEAYLYRPDIMAKIIFWLKFIEDLLPEKQIALSDDVELFLQIDGNDCAYYFIDHSTHTEFWLDSLVTDDLNMFPVASPSHLKLALEELYWVHVEHFPMHIGGLPKTIVDQLVCVFSHAVADHMTSRFSTFPYSATECTKFLKLLKTSQEYTNDGHTVCLVARLWSLVFSHRFTTYYGEENARLSRDQSILVDSTQESRILAATTSFLSFKTSDTYTTRLNDIFTDRLVYLHQWRPFMTKCLQDWRRISYLTLPVLMLHTLLFFIRSSTLLAIISALCLGSSLVSSTLLVHRHEELEDASAARALSYLETICSERFKFQLVALVYSLPKALYFWGLGVFILNWIFILIEHVSTSLSTGFLCICCLAVLAFQRTTSQNSGFDTFSQLLSLFKRKNTEDESMV